MDSSPWEVLNTTVAVLGAALVLVGLVGSAAWWCSAVYAKLNTAVDELKKIRVEMVHMWTTIERHETRIDNHSERITSLENRP